MDLDRPAIVANPRSGGGLSERAWARLAGAIADGLGAFDVLWTKAPGHGRELAEGAARAGRSLVVALGGDGTINEVANGLLDAKTGAALGVLPRGTGGDLRRTLDLPANLFAAARRLRDGRVSAIDVGRATYATPAGGSEIRAFVNVSSFGLSSDVAARANASSKRLGAKASFLAATARGLLGFDPIDVEIAIDDAPAARQRLLLGAVGNARYFGGGMKICPDAALDDGRLDAVLVAAMSALAVATNLPRLFAGTHLSLKEVSAARARRVRVAPVDADRAIPLELDGETPGRLPVNYEIEPGALRLRA